MYRRLAVEIRVIIENLRVTIIQIISIIINIILRVLKDYFNLSRGIIVVLHIRINLRR